MFGLKTLRGKNEELQEVVRRLALENEKLTLRLEEGFDRYTSRTEGYLDKIPPMSRQKMMEHLAVGEDAPLLLAMLWFLGGQEAEAREAAADLSLEPWATAQLSKVATAYAEAGAELMRLVRKANNAKMGGVKRRRPAAAATMGTGGKIAET